MSMSQARTERRTERRRRKYQHEHQVIEALARHMASKAYEGMRQDGPSTPYRNDWGGKMDPATMAYWRAQAILALEFCQDY
jgi:hypothetical protein